MPIHATLGVDGKVPAAQLPALGGTPTWDSVTGKPTTFVPAAHTHVIADTTGLQTSLDGKQATLVSGTNIKTINGTPILGTGDLVISGGGGSSPILSWAL